MKYKKGTQEMLDAAKDDATLLPFDTVFVTGDTADSLPPGTNVVRSKNKYACNDAESIGFEMVDNDRVFHYFIADILPAKKSKPKKWQNGTQAQLDAAKDDARLIPKKTYFRHKEVGFWWNRADCAENNSTQVLMVAWGAGIPPRMVCASDLVIA